MINLYIKTTMNCAGITENMRPWDLMMGKGQAEGSGAWLPEAR